MNAADHDSRTIDRERFDDLGPGMCRRCARALGEQRYELAAIGPLNHELRWAVCEGCWLVLLAVVQEELLNGTAWGRRLLREQHVRNERARRSRKRLHGTG